MKKLFVLGGIFAVLLVATIFLTGCSTKTATVELTSPNETAAAMPAENETPAVPDENITAPASNDSLNMPPANMSSNATSNATSNMTSNVSNTASNSTPTAKLRNLTLEFIDLEGNSILIRTPSRKNIVIDGGRNNDGLKLVKYLLNKGLAKIDYVMSSNAESDNTGGLPSVVFNFNNSQAYYNGIDYNNNHIAYRSYINYANAYSHPPIAITKNKVFDVSDGIQLSAFVPFEDSQSNGEPADDTTVFRLDYEDASFLFLGDCRGVCFDNIKGNNIKADVLYAYGDVPEEIIEMVSPKIILYSEVSNSTIQPEGVKVYSKSDGTVLIMSDGSRYFISSLGKA